MSALAHGPQVFASAMRSKQCAPAIRLSFQAGCCVVARPCSCRQTGSDQIATSRRFPIQHFTCCIGVRHRVDHQAFVQTRLAHTPSGRDCLVHRTQTRMLIGSALITRASAAGSLGRGVAISCNKRNLCRIQLQRFADVVGQCCLTTRFGQPLGDRPASRSGARSIINWMPFTHTTRNRINTASL